MLIDNAITYFRYLTGAFQSSQGRSRVRLIQLEDRAGRKLKGTGVTGITKAASANAESRGCPREGRDAKASAEMAPKKTTT